MNGHTAYPAYALSPDEYTVSVSFGGNDVGAPVAVRTNRGLPASVVVARTDVGKYTLTFGAGMTVPSSTELLAIIASAEPVNLAGAFNVLVLAGNTLTSTRILTVQCVDFAGNAVELPASGTSRVNVQITFVNNTGR